jgi:hypothetical protein
MQRGYVKHSIGFFFLTIFLMVKMAGLHVLAHDGDQDHYAHCVVCDHIVKNHDAPELSLAFTDYTIMVPEPIPQDQASNEYGFLSDGVLTIDQLFSRPPPGLI